MTNSRHLVRPSPHVPWDVSVTAVVPALLQETVISQNKVAAYASFSNIKAIMSTEGKISLIRAVQGDSSVSGTAAVAAAQDTTTGTDSKKVWQTLYHPLLARSEKLLFDISGDDDSYYIFALNATTGFLALWCLPRKGKETVVPKPCNAKLRLSLDVHVLTAVGNSLYLGSSTGGAVWKCTVSARPMVLTALELTRTSTMWNRVFGSGGPQSPIVALVPSGGEGLHSVTESGFVELWNDDDKGTPVCNLEEMLETHIKDDAFDTIQVLCASCAKDQLDFIVKIVFPRQARFYWLRLVKGGAVLEQCQWLNRFHETVTCQGIVSCDNGMAYACFSAAQQPVTVLCLSKHIHEVDLPSAEAPAVVGMGRDVETHGCVFVTNQGLVLRARWMQLQQAVLASTSDEESHVLARHLRSAFWHYYQTHQLQLAPSLTAANVNVEAAIVLTARQLQQEGDASSSHNPMEWHLALIQMLKQAGFYKNLSSSGRWTLLGIGQELAIHSILQKSNLFVKELPPHGLAVKVAQVQRHVLDHAPTMEWSVVLAQVLQTAAQYRETHVISTYDVLQDPRHLWTHDLKDVLLLQLKHPESAKVETLEVIVAEALQVHQETQSKDYALVKSLGINLIRSDELRNDSLAHELSLQHAYYEGLCQLFIDNPEEYSLEPILDKWGDFGAFCLRWFTQQGHLDKVLSYGKLLPDTFALLVKDQLPEYQWVHALRKKRYGVVSDCLFQNATGQDVEQTEWHLSMAKLAAKVHNAGKSGNDEDAGDYRRKRIDNKLDLVKAQRALIDENVPLQTPDYLLKLALDKCDKEADASVVGYAMMGLVIASAGENMDGIATVWSKAISKDMEDKWTVWIKSQPPSRIVLVEDTVFGQLWKHVQEQPVEVHSTMQYDPNVLEELVMRKLSLDRGAARELKRLLRSVTTIVLQSQSLMAGAMETQ